MKTHDFRRQLKAAQAGGFDSLAIGRLTFRQLLDEGLSPAEIRLMASDHGVKLGHYDGFARWAPYEFSEDTPAPAREVFADSVDECLRMCDQLGLPAICATGVYDPGAAEDSRLIDAFGEFCLRAERMGVAVDLECIPMWAIPDLAAAWRLVDGARSPNAGLLLDSWHFFRGSADMDLLRALPEGSVRTVQLADALPLPLERDLLEDCLHYRMLPGAGCMPLADLLEVLHSKGGVQSIGPEIFSDHLDGMEADDAACRSSSACRKLLAAAASKESVHKVTPPIEQVINKADRS